VRTFCGCVTAGLLRKDLKFVDSSFERDPLVGAGMECDWSLLLGVMMCIVVLLWNFEDGVFFLFWMEVAIEVVGCRWVWDV
jgi:hypothetical protein